MWAYPHSNTPINPIIPCNVRECMSAYPHSNTSINPYHLLFHATFENACGRIRSPIHPSILIYYSMQRSRMHVGVSALQYIHQSLSFIVPCKVRECMWAYPHSNKSINPHHLLFHATFENASGQYPLSNIVTSVDPVINLVKRLNNSSNVSGRTSSSHWHAK